MISTSEKSIQFHYNFLKPSLILDLFPAGSETDELVDNEIFIFQYDIVIEKYFEREMAVTGHSATPHPPISLSF